MSGFEKAGYLSDEVREVEKRIKQNHDKLFDLAFALNEFAQELLYSINVHNRDPQEIFAAILYGRVLDFFQGAYRLACMGLEDPAVVLIRGMYEAFALLQANEKNSEFFKKMIEDDEYRRKGLLESAEKYDSPLLVDIRELENNNKEMEKLKAMKPKPLSIEAIFREAGLIEEYHSAYALLSNPAHHGARSLEKHLVVEGEEGKIVSLAREPGDTKLHWLFNVGGGTLVASMQSIYNLFEMDNKDFRDKVFEIKDALTKQMEDMY